MSTIEARLSLHPRRALDMLRLERGLRRAAKAIPKPMPWEWARPRLLPLLAGPHLGPDRIVTTVSPLGCAVIYGIEVRGAFLILDSPVAERWECSPALLDEVATANLAERASRLVPEDVQRGVLSGRVTNLLDSVAWASSLVLAPDHLMRLFGPHDQFFGAPRRDALLSFSIETPSRVIADIVSEFEANSAYPLWLDPFGLFDGVLSWGGDSDEAEPDDW